MNSSSGRYNLRAIEQTHASLVGSIDHSTCRYHLYCNRMLLQWRYKERHRWPEYHQDCNIQTVPILAIRGLQGRGQGTMCIV